MMNPTLITRRRLLIAMALSPLHNSGSPLYRRHRSLATTV
ncbi:hypothetical protein ACQSHX_25590, partial [Klebsiella pneumoniae]